LTANRRYSTCAEIETNDRVFRGFEGHHTQELRHAVPAGEGRGFEGFVTYFDMFDEILSGEKSCEKVVKKL
jgi:hypothetical protein